MKKRTMTTWATAALLLFAMNGFSQAPAQNSTDKQKAQQQTAVRGPNFVDQNKNGVCDNREGNQANGRGRNFVDKNNDGKCDNFKGQGNQRGGNGCNGQGYGYRHGNQGQCKGNGNGYRHRNGNGNCQNQPQGK